MMTRDLTLKEEEELNSLLTEDEITLQKLNNLSLYSTTIIIIIIMDLRKIAINDQ